MELSLLELWDSAGTFSRGIILVLAIMSVISLTVASRKWWRFRNSMKETARFAPEFAQFLQEEQLDEAIELAEKQKVSHVARVLGEALVEIKPLLRDRAQITSGDINSAERAVDRQMLILQSELSGNGRIDGAFHWAARNHDGDRQLVYRNGRNGIGWSWCDLRRYR